MLHTPSYSHLPPSGKWSTAHPAYVAATEIVTFFYPSRNFNNHYYKKCHSTSTKMQKKKQRATNDSLSLSIFDNLRGVTGTLIHTKKTRGAPNYIVLRNIKIMITRV